MARPRVKINPERGKRLKNLCEWEGITQQNLAEKIHISQQTVSQMVQGKSTVTEQTAEEIAAAFPKYRKEWLLGFDDFPTEDSKLSDMARMIDDIYHSVLLLVGAIAEKNGYKRIDTNLARGMVFASDDGGKLIISNEDYEKMLEEEIIAYTDFRFKRLIEKSKGGHNG